MTTLNPQIAHICCVFLWDHSGSELGHIYISLLIPLAKINVLICNKTLNYNVFFFFYLISVDFMWCSIHFKLYVKILQC